MSEQKTQNAPSLGKAIDAFEQLKASLDITAQEVTQGNFAASGSGLTSIAFRAARDTPDDLMEDIWSQILSLGEALWNDDQILASIVLVETSYNTFFVPPEMDERIQTSLESAKDLKIIKNAEEAFNAGDDQKAKRLADSLTSTVKTRYNLDLDKRIKSRATSRKAALWLGGVSISSLVIAAGIGLFSFLELMQDPPRPELPSFTHNQRMIGDLFSSDGSQTLSSERDAPIAEELPLPAEDVREQIPLVHSGLQFDLAPELDEISPIPEPEPQDGPATSSIEQSVTEQPARLTTKPADPAEEGAITFPSSPQVTRDHCMMGYAVLQRAAIISAEQTAPETAAAKLAAFMSTLRDACGSYDIDPFSAASEAGKFDQAMIEDIANGILE